LVNDLSALQSTYVLYRDSIRKIVWPTYGIVDLNISLSTKPVYLSSMAALYTYRECMSDTVTRLLNERKDGTGCLNLDFQRLIIPPTKVMSRSLQISKAYKTFFYAL
jgi:hypothetical protein